MGNVGINAVNSRRQNPADIDESAAKQLDVLRRIDLILTEIEAGFWLRGGWAVDFLLGRISRPHADLDLVLWHRDRARVHQALESAGFETVRELPGQIDYMSDGQDITCIYLKQSAEGSTAAFGIADWQWDLDALPMKRRCLAGFCVRTVSPEHMLRDFEGYERATGRPLRQKDHKTIAQLRDLLRSS